MIEIFDRENGSSLGNITEDQLNFLMQNLEEEAYRDQDYYIDKQTIDTLTEKGMDSELKNLLINALGKREAMEILWEDV